MDICHIKIITEFIVAQKKTFVSTFCEKITVYTKKLSRRPYRDIKRGQPMAVLLNLIWSGRGESDPPLKLGKLTFYQ